MVRQKTLFPTQLTEKILPHTAIPNLFFVNGIKTQRRSCDFPSIGENPDELLVYAGIGKAGRNWDCFDAMVSGQNSPG